MWYILKTIGAPAQFGIIYSFTVFTKLPDSQSDDGNLENLENTCEINCPLPEGTCDYLFVTLKGQRHGILSYFDRGQN